jgi:general secretion pathway protein M
MSARFSQWWNSLSRREHALLGIAGALTLAVLASAALWGPIGGAYAGVEAEYRAASERQARMAAKVALLKTPAADGGAAALPVDALVRDTAAEIGVTLDRNEARGADGASVAIATIRAQALFPWLDRLEQQGLVIDQLTVTAAPDRTLAVVADMRRAR